MTCALQNHPQRHTVGIQLQHNTLLAGLDDSAQAELRALLAVQDCQRGECLIEQGARELQQLFVLEGVVKRVITSPDGREMTLRFAGEGDMETCYDAWLAGSVAAYSLVCATRSRVAVLPMRQWCDFLERHPRAQRAFQQRIVQLGATIVEHAVGLLMLDAPGRVQRFAHSHPELAERLPQKDLASHLNLSAETLCRLSRRVRCAAAAAACVPL